MARLFHHDAATTDGNATNATSRAASFSFNAWVLSESLRSAAGLTSDSDDAAVDGEPATPKGRARALAMAGCFGSGSPRTPAADADGLPWWHWPRQQSPSPTSAAPSPAGASSPGRWWRWEGTARSGDDATKLGFASCFGR